MYTTLTIQTITALAVLVGVLMRAVFKRVWAWMDSTLLPARYLKKRGVRRRVGSNPKTTNI
ncbi:cellulose biosynthesis protein BcsF [Alcaligenaceae bacterium]|nr:cellulose biosynthesis protein BcsF [Alcaligenaceae bacterium]